MKAGKSLQELALEIDRQNKVKKDYIASTQDMVMTIEPNHLVSEGNGKLNYIPKLGLPGLEAFTINNIAHDQIGAKLEIPSKYYDRMLEKEPELLADNVNTWFRNKPSKRMIRTLDGTTRAFLSDKYRRIDNFEIAQAVLPMIGELEDSKVESCELTESRMYIKVLNPKVQTEIVKGDVVQSGILISNSETGMGSVTVMPLVMRLVCTNGMIASDSGQRKFHMGRANEVDGGFEVYRNETLMADDKAFMMKLQDIVKATIDIVHFERIVAQMKLGAETKITGDVPKVVELTAKNYGLGERESEGVLNHLIRGGDLSLYGLANAVTRHAQDVTSYDRSTELEMTGWNILSMPRNEWAKLNKAA